MPRESRPQRSERGGVKIELKIWRYDASTGERALRPYEVDVSDDPFGDVRRGHAHLQMLKGCA